MDISINIPFDESFKDTHLWNCMFGYQKEGVQKVISTFNGRALIGDEMGLGKTLQAISVYKYYNAKKLLVICPAYLRFTWKRNWKVGTGHCQQCHQNGKDPLDVITPLIISYELAAAKAKELKRCSLTWWSVMNPII